MTSELWKMRRTVLKQLGRWEENAWVKLSWDYWMREQLLGLAQVHAELTNGTLIVR